MKKQGLLDIIFMKVLKGCRYSLSIIWYSLRIPDEGKRMWLKDICRVLTVAGASHEQVLEAIENVQFKDFEDCL